MLARPASIMAQQGSRNWVLAGRGAISAKTIARTAILSLCVHAQLKPLAKDCRADCLSFPSFSFIFSILLFVYRASSICWMLPPNWLVRSEEHTSELQSLRHLVC